VRLTKDWQKDGFALLKGSDLQGGTVEADIPFEDYNAAGRENAGVCGHRFLARPGASRHELFYLRPGNSHADD